MTAWRVHTATLFYSLLTSLTDIDLFLDIGSLDGRESFLVEARFPRLKCIAFEPNPRNIEVIKGEIVRRRSLIDLETYALGNEEGQTTFYTRIPLGSNNYGASSMLKFASTERNEEFSTRAIEVPMHRLDRLEQFKTARKVALWIDVEGAGYHVLEGMAELAEKAQIVHIEVETQRLFAEAKQATDVMRIMHQYGFELIGSNLDKQLHRHQGDMVFLRRHILSALIIKRAVLGASLLETLQVQRLARGILPPRLYRAGRDWLVQVVTAR